MKWEYFVTILPEMEPQQPVLNTLGAHDWELITVVSYEDQRVAYLKRPINLPEDMEQFEAKVLEVIRRYL